MWSVLGGVWVYHHGAGLGWAGVRGGAIGCRVPRRKVCVCTHAGSKGARLVILGDASTRRIITGSRCHVVAGSSGDNGRLVDNGGVSLAGGVAINTHRSLVVRLWLFFWNGGMG